MRIVPVKELRANGSPPRKVGRVWVVDVVHKDGEDLGPAPCITFPTKTEAEAFCAETA